MNHEWIIFTFFLWAWSKLPIYCLVSATLNFYFTCVAWLCLYRMNLANYKTQTELFRESAMKPLNIADPPCQILRHELFIVILSHPVEAASPFHQSFQCHTVYLLWFEVNHSTMAACKGFAFSRNEWQVVNFH